MPVTPKASDLGLTRTFATHAAAARWPDLPGAVRCEAIRTVLNSVGCALGGAGHPVCDQVAAFAGPLSGPSVATILGRSHGADAARAALLNGLAGSVHAFDDTHARSIVHPGTPVTMAALAAAEASGQRLAGDAFLNAAAWGVEITCRISRTISTGMPMAVSQTGTVGTIGAAVAAGLVLGLDAQRLGWAIGIAAASAAGIRAGHGTVSMHLLPARAASAGVEAALLARAGCDSGGEAFAGPHGFFAAFGGRTSPDGLLDGLGEHFELTANTYKPYPCGIVVHPVIDACLELHPRVATRIAQIEEIRLVVAPQAIALADRKQPTSELEAQVSLQHWAAAALMVGRAGIDEGQMRLVTGDEHVSRLRARCAVSPDPSRALDQARVEIRLADGSVRGVEVAHCRGSEHRPMTDVELDAKFVAQAARTLGEAGAERALAVCRSIDAADDLAAVMRALVP